MAQVLTKNVVSILFMYLNLILFHCKQLTLDVPSIHVPGYCLFEFQFYFYHVLEYCKIVRMQSQIYCTFFTKVSWRNRRFEKAGVAAQVR